MASKTIGGISGVLGELISVPPTPVAPTKREQSPSDDRKASIADIPTYLSLLRPLVLGWTPSWKQPTTGRSKRESDASRTMRTDRRISGLVMGSQVPTRRVGERALLTYLNSVAAMHKGQMLESEAQTFVLETILTAMLKFVILAVSSRAKEKGLMAGIAIGGVIALEALFAGPIAVLEVWQTGTQLQPLYLQLQSLRSQTCNRFHNETASVCNDLLFCSALADAASDSYCQNHAAAFPAE